MGVPEFDAFARARVSEPVTLFDSQLQYNAQPLLWETSGDGTARGAAVAGLVSKLPMVLDTAGENPIVLAVVITGVGGTPTAYASLNWRELY